MNVRRLRPAAIWMLVACGEDPAAPLTDPDKLSSRGLYADIDARHVVSDAFEYTPDYPLWSDGADKRRWLILPKGERIDIRDPAHWDFPLGAKLFKEFSLDGRLLETRLIERTDTTGRVKEDFFMATFVWDIDQRDASLEMDGHDNVAGTEHDVPAQKYCIVCHRGEPSGILGFSAVQLSASGALHEAFERGLLSDEPERTYTVPGDEVQRPALGTLHANCGHCHADGATADFMHLRILPDEVDLPIEELDAYTSTVGVALSDEWEDHPPRFTTRIVPGEPEQSSILYRMQQRGQDELVPDQMPPLATRKVDDDAVAAVRAWIASLPTAPRTPEDGGADASVPAQTAPDAGMSGDAGAIEPGARKPEPMGRMDAGTGAIGPSVQEPESIPSMDAGAGPPDETSGAGGSTPSPSALEMDAAVDAGSTTIRPADDDAGATETPDDGDASTDEDADGGADGL